MNFLSEIPFSFSIFVYQQWTSSKFVYERRLSLGKETFVEDASHGFRKANNSKCTQNQQNPITALTFDEVPLSSQKHKPLYGLSILCWATQSFWPQSKAS